MEASIHTTKDIKINNHTNLNRILNIKISIYIYTDMASYAPPTQDSAIFNPLFFVSGQEGLTLNEAKKFFLQYPDAQGTENLETTNVDGVLTANDQAFFNDKITLEQTQAGGDALNILVDSPGYAIRTTTRTNPSTNTQLTIIPSATDGEINSMVKLGDALLYSSTGQIATGSMSLTAYNADDDFGIRLNGDDDIVEIGGLVELMTDTGIQFYDGTIQNTAYTGDGTDTLGDVLDNGNIASQDIYMNNNNLTYVNNLQFGTSPGLLMGLNSNTLYVSQLASNPSVNNMVSYDPATGLFTYCPSAYQPGSINIGENAGQGVAGGDSVHIGKASGGTSGYASVGIGLNSGIQGGAQSVAIGVGSGFQIGSDCVAIGANAGGNPAGNSICLNATGSGLNPVHQGLYIDPVRNQAPVSTDILYYNTTTKEVYYDTIIETGLASTLLANNSAGTTDIDMNGNDITNVSLINGVAYPPPASSANLTSVSITYASITLNSGVFIQNNLTEQLNIPSGGRWLIQTQYRIYSATDSATAQTLINSRFTSQGFGGFGASVSSQDYELSSFTNGTYSSRFGFTHSTSAIVANQAGFTMFAMVEVAGQSLAGGCLGEGYATAIRIGDYP